MIARLSGTLIAKHPPLLVVDVAGVGYEVEATGSVFSKLPELGQPVSLVTHLQVKDDAHTLYGFVDESERVLFRQLLKVNGIGAKLALTILSGISATDLAHVVAAGDSASLIRLPGIGRKTADRIIMELRDKLQGMESSGAFSTPGKADRDGTPAGEASTALSALGYKPQEVSRMLQKFARPGLSTEEIIRLALQSTVGSS